jgi:hypothetical protein
MRSLSLYTERGLELLSVAQFAHHLKALEAEVKRMYSPSDIATLQIQQLLYDGTLF